VKRRAAAPRPAVELDLSRVRTYPLAGRASKVAAAALGRTADPSMSIGRFLRTLPDILGARDLRSALSSAIGVEIAPGGDSGPASSVPDFWGLKEFDAFLLVVDGVPWGGAFNPITGGGGGFGGGTYKLGDIGVTAPVGKFTPEPDFTEEARKAKYQGTVVLSAVIGPDGRPRNIRVVRSLGMGLDEKAVERVKTWLFEPGKKNGTPVAVAMNFEVDFRLF
jgi:TonB family protein